MKLSYAFFLLVVCAAGCVSQNKNGEIIGKLDFETSTEVSSNHIAVLSIFKRNLIKSTYEEVSEKKLNPDGSFHFSELERGLYSVEVRKSGGLVPLVGRIVEVANEPVVIRLLVRASLHE
ncbi:hypothetical protein ACG1BZ_09355 [Microbulbifer sp. CNSA002]|uniref:hypothetical protein n=1 Tax=Microbulbifer sp. CNSA002 TaxID=3373604 RepID=UPI0039B607AF